MGPTALALTVAAAILVTVLAIVPVSSAAWLLPMLAWFALPGLVLGRRLYGTGRGGWIAALFVGPAWGYVLSSLVLLGLWAAGIRSIWWLMLSPLPAALAVWPARRLAPLLEAPPLSRRDLAAAAFLLLAVLAIVGRPYARVGADLPDGRAYRAYFTADFVWAMAVAAEVSKGDVPPLNPYYLDDELHYYWLMHLLPAAAHRAAGESPSIGQILLINALWTGLAFAGFFYFFVRHWVDRPWVVAVACAGVLFCSSFEGAERIWSIWQRGAPYDELRHLNIDAIANWIYGGMKVDGLHRMLLYQPQHQLGYLLGLSALLLLVQARDVSRPGLLFLAGVFLGGSMLFSALAAGMLAAMAALYEGLRLARARQWRAFIPCAVAAAVPMGAALALSTALHYVDTTSTGNPLVRFGLNSLAAHRVTWSMFLNFGPVLIVAVFGLAAVVAARKAGRFLPIWLVLLVSGLFYFLVDVPDHDSVYVAWRASHLAFIAFAVLCGFGLQEWWGRGGWRRHGMLLVTAAAAIVALPTVAVDVYNAQDVTNRANGPGFRWTVMLGPGELEGLDWIRQSTPWQARVQVEPVVRGRDTWAYMAAFGERRMAAGLPIGMIPVAKYEEASARVKEVYTSTSAHQAYERAARLCIDYLVVGPPERAAYPDLQPAIDASPHIFPPVFRNDALAVYAVPGSFSRPECPH